MNDFNSFRLIVLFITNMVNLLQYGITQIPTLTSTKLHLFMLPIIRGGQKYY